MSNIITTEKKGEEEEEECRRKIWISKQTGAYACLLVHAHTRFNSSASKPHSMQTIVIVNETASAHSMLIMMNFLSQELKIQFDARFFLILTFQNVCAQ